MQKVNFTDILNAVIENWNEIPFVQWGMIALFIFFFVAFVWSCVQQKTNVVSKFAPSVMTAAGLLGTFVGLTFGLKDLNLDDRNSMNALIEGLKSVFVYSLLGVSSAVLFMLLNMIPNMLQARRSSKELEKNRKDRQRNNQDVLSILTDSRDQLKNLQMGHDYERMAQLIGESVQEGLRPTLEAIQKSVAEQSGETLARVLKQLTEKVLSPMYVAVQKTTDAVDKMTGELQQTREQSQALITAVGEAADKMQQASESMNGVVVKVNETVNSMGDIQTEQQNTLEKFNQDLQTNLNEIEPAITRGLSSAEHALTSAIETSSEKMQENLKTAGQAFYITVQQFSKDMDKNLNRMATELTQIGSNSKQLINEASTNLKATLGDIDQKLLNTQDTLQKSLELFRLAYQENLTSYLNQQDDRLNGFLDKQNTQLELTIGAQRQGLQEVTDNLKTNFENMVKELDKINKHYEKVTTRLDGIQQSTLPKVQEIAKDLKSGRDDFAKNIETVSNALQSLGESLPNQIEGSYQILNDEYKKAFSQLDGGVADVTQQLVGATKLLATSLDMYNAVRERA